MFRYHNGTGNTTRPESMTFPDGDLLGYAYAGTKADKLSRIDKLTLINESTLDGKDLCEYDYLGMGTAVTTRYRMGPLSRENRLGAGCFHARVRAVEPEPINRRDP